MLDTVFLRRSSCSCTFPLRLLSLWRYFDLLTFPPAGGEVGLGPSREPAIKDMAKGNMLLGYARGKVGDLVFSRRSGEQVTRARAAKVTNPRSTAQQIQRMIFGSVSFAYSLMRSICDHSFEGVQYGQRSMSKFFSLNLKALRDYYPTDQDPNKQPIDAKAYILPSREGAIGCGLQISAGTLPEIAPRISDNGIFNGFGKPISIPEGKQFTIARMLECLGAVKGDQITVVGVTDNNRLVKSRYVVRADATESEINVEWNDNGENAAFDTTRTEVGEIRLEIGGTAQQGFATVDPAGLTSVAVILSRKDGNKWLRSNAWLWNTADEAPQYSAAYALPYWEMSKTDIDTLDKKYLNNADI